MKNDWEFDHAGLVVNDLDEILTYYPSLGIGIDIGPLSPNAVNPVPGSPEEEPVPTTMEVYGKPFTPRRRPVYTTGVFVNRIIENIQMGDLVIECIHGRPDGDGFNDDYFRNSGEGISHVCYNVPDPEGDTEALGRKGIGVVMSLEANGKILENYVDTAEYGDIWFSFRPPAHEHHKAWQAHNRAHPLVSDWKFYGMGVATRNLEKAVTYYRNMDIITMQHETVLDTGASAGFKVHGLTGQQVKVRMQTGVTGSIAYEFAQTLEQKTTFGKCLFSKGEGVYSLNFTVKDLESESSRLVYRGVEILLSGKDETGKPFAYFDTRKVGNLLIKLVEG